MANTEMQRNAYRTHLCHVMAIALARRTGLPLGLIAGERDARTGSRAVAEYDYGRAIVIVDTDRPAWLDVDGLHVGLGAAAFQFAEPVDRIMIVPASEDSVARAFGAGGNFRAKPVSQVDIDDAGNFIRDDSDLTAALEMLKLSEKVMVTPNRDP
jgi:hypothetical protein